jgi:hypothetical protein
LVFEKKNRCYSFIGYLFGYPVATYMGYSTEGILTGFGCSGLSTLGAGGQGIFLPVLKGGSLVSGFKTLYFLFFLLFSIRLCAPQMGRGWEDLKIFYHLDVMITI